MRDKRPVDELSIEELERILAIRKREERMKRLKRMEKVGRVIETASPQPRPAIAPTTASNLSATAHTDSTPAFVEESDFLARPKDDRLWRIFVDRSLLLVELAAVVGLLVIAFGLFNVIGQLETETKAAQQLAEEQRRAGIPTIAPTPQLRLSQFVLPGGHTPPTQPGGGQFNIEEVPVHLRSLVQEQVLNPLIERPPATDETPLRIIIPKINVDQTIVQGTDWEALKLGVGQVLNGATPNNPTANVVLAAHNDIYGEIFRHLDQLEVGDQFQIQTRAKIYTYTVTGREVVNPDAVWVMDSRGRSTATLISCYPYQVNTKRIIIFADLNEAFSS